MKSKFQVGDKVKFESPNPAKAGQFYTGTIMQEGAERVEPNGQKVPGYWIDHGRPGGTWTWQRAEDLELA